MSIFPGMAGLFFIIMSVSEKGGVMHAANWAAFAAGCLLLVIAYLMYRHEDWD